MPSDNPNKQRIVVICGADGLFVPAIEALGDDTFSVERTLSVYRGIAAFAQNPADIAVIDIDALNEGEMDCLRVLRDVNPSVRILVVFTMANRLRAAHALEQGADAMLQQPFYPAEFGAIVRRWSAAKRQDAAIDNREHRAALARLALGTAHEVNNPLCTLSGWLQMMELDDSRSAKERERFASMREEADRIAKVVENLLAFGEDSPSHQDAVNIDQLLAGIAGEMKDRAADVRVEADLAAPEARVFGDRELLGRALRMLMEDAIAACNGDGRITVRSQPKGRLVAVSVRDNGRHIPRDALENLFEPYRHMPRMGESLSLAYPAVYGIVRCHGGDVTVSSDAKNGTEFILTLPVQPSLVRESAP